MNKDQTEIITRLAVIERHLHLTNGLRQRIVTKLDRKVGKKEFYTTVGILYSLILTLMGIVIYVN